MQKKEGGIIDKWSIILPSRTQSATINGGSQPTKGLVGMQDGSGNGLQKT
jgi:hypothetical protein